MTLHKTPVNHKIIVETEMFVGVLYEYNLNARKMPYDYFIFISNSV